MITLLKILNEDLIKQISLYCYYTKIDMEWFKFLHYYNYKRVLVELYLCRHRCRDSTRRGFD